MYSITINISHYKEIFLDSLAKPSVVCPMIYRNTFRGGCSMTGLAHWCRTFACLLVLAVFVPTLLFAQSADSALVRINVVDTTGATIPNASASVTNEGTGVVFTCSTDQNGRCNLNTLSPGNYTVKITATSFKTSVREHVELHVGQAADLN